MDYQQQAKDFLESTGTEFSLRFIKWDKHFTDDKDKRDIYEVTLKRGDRVYKFMFGQSIAHSGKFEVATHDGMAFVNNKKDSIKLKPLYIRVNKNFQEPTAYDVLSCLQKNDVGDFKNFCADFGYDTDSIKASKTYEAVKDEWNNIKILYSDDEITKLGEIQ